MLARCALSEMAANSEKDSSVDPDSTRDDDKNTLLHEAAKKGQLDKLRHLIKEKNCDPRCTDKDGWAIVHHAALNGHLEVIQFLCNECGIDPKSYEAENRTTLPHLAVRNGHLNVLRYLINEKHCDPMCKDENGQTILHLAALFGHLQVVQYLIDECGMDLECRDDTNRKTPLHYAAQNEQLRILTYLIKEKHCDPMYRDNCGHTIFYLPTITGDLLQIAPCLIDKCGVDPKLCWEEIMTIPFIFVVKNGLMRILRYFIKEKDCNPIYVNKYGRTILHEAAFHGQLNAVQFLIDECGVDPKLCLDDRGCTALHLAAQNGQLHVVKCLINEKQCDPMCRDNCGHTIFYLPTIKGDLLQITPCLIDECGMDPKLCWEEIMCVSFTFVVKNGLMRILRYFIKEKDCNPIYVNKHGRTILHEATFHGQLNAVQFLIDECGVDPKLCLDDRGCTALHLAAQNGQLHVVKCLINEKQCDPMCRDQDGETVLHKAASEGQLQVLQFLIDKCGVDPDSCRDDRGLTLLYYAAQIKALNVLRYLVKQKHCEIMCGDKTVLHEAAECGNLQVVQCLIDDCGVDPMSCWDDNGQTPLHAAAIEGQQSIVRYLVKVKHCDPMCADRDGWTVIHLAAYFGCLQVMRCLIDECGVDPMSCQDGNGLTPLNYAAQQGEVTILRYLIKEKHCDPSSTNKPILHIAAFHGHLKAVKCLIDECGIDPNCQSDFGYAMHHAAAKGQLSVLKYLVKEKHCDPMRRGKLGSTVLHLAAYFGHLQVMKFLIDECSVDPKSCQDDEGKTPLHYAAQQKELNVMEYLIKEKQCDPTLEDNSGKTALQESDFLGHLEFVKHLVEKCGVDPKSFQAQLGKFTSTISEYLKSKGVSDLEVQGPEVTTTQDNTQEHQHTISSCSPKERKLGMYHNC